MKKKFLANSVGIIAMCLVMVPGMTTYAKDTHSEEKAAIMEQSELPANAPLFTTKYYVSAKKTTIKSGPGTNYSSMGTLYKNDVLWVKSISNGWAKFKWNSKWAYISASSIKRHSK